MQLGRERVGAEAEAEAEGVLAASVGRSTAAGRVGVSEGAAEAEAEAEGVLAEGSVVGWTAAATTMRVSVSEGRVNATPRRPGCCIPSTGCEGTACGWP